MATRLGVKRIPEGGAQAIGLGVHVSFDERPAIRPVQLDHDVALLATQLIDDGRERVTRQLARAGVAAPQADGRGAVCAENEEPAAAQFPAEVGEKGRARVVHPVQVVEEEEQGLLPADRSQGPQQLVEQGALRRVPCERGSQPG